MGYLLQANQEPPVYWEYICVCISSYVYFLELHMIPEENQA